VRPVRLADHSAEYESFALSTAIILIVPMCLLCGIAA
jgi:multidrug efflux pump